MTAKHPQVHKMLSGVWWDGQGANPTDEPLGAPAHKVVPLDALVIVKDDNGEWPELVVGEAAALMRGWGVENAVRRDMVRDVLDALEAAQKEGGV